MIFTHPLRHSIVARFAFAASAAIFSLASPALRAAAPAAVTWSLARTDQLGGHTTTVLGSPKVVQEDGRTAVAFDGAHDGLILPVNPLSGLTQFTIQLLIKPDSHGPAEQRFFHIQDAESNRCLLEIRLTPEGKWALDTFLFCGKSSLALLDPKLLHSADEWHWVTLHYDGKKMSSFVDGKPELSGDVAFTSVSSTGQTSIGVRLNQVFWFKGAIREVRIHPVALPFDQLAR